MKKILLPLSLTSVLSLAQQNTGINTTNPQATLEVASKTENTTNEVEGLLIPRVSKQKALLMAQNTATPLVESTLIYVNNLTDFVDPADGTETSVAAITGNGYYHWNGTEWVKVVGKEGELWAQREVNGNIETYLRPAEANGDKISYNSDSKDNVVFYKYLTSNTFPLENTTSNWWGFNDASYFIKADHINNANNPNNEVNYQAQFRGIYTDNTATGDIKSLIGGTNVATIGDTRDGSTAGTPLTSIDVGSVKGFSSRVDNYTSGNVAIADGFNTVNSNYGGGYVGSMAGIDVLNRNYGTTGTSYGIRSRNYLMNSNNASTDYAYGAHFSLYANPTTSVNKSIQGLRTDVILNNSMVNSNFNHGLRNIFTLSNGSTIGSFEGTNVTFYGDNASSITDFTGYRLYIPNYNEAVVTNMYGIKLDDIQLGTGANYSIFTGSGDIRFGDLTGTGERIVTADANGVLGTSTTIAQAVAANSEWKDATLTRNLADGRIEDYDVIYANQANLSGNDVVISDNGYVGIGTDDPIVDLSIVGKEGENAEILLTRYANNGNGANLTLYKAYGTPDAPQVPPVGGSLSRFRAGGYTGGGDGSNNQTNSGWDGFASQIITVVAGEPNANGTLPTDMIFRVTNNQGFRNTLLKLQGNSGVGVGLLPADDVKARLHIKDWNDVTPTSEHNALMIGEMNGLNLVMDVNEIMARKNGAIANLNLQQEGGNVTFNALDPVTTNRSAFNKGSLGIGTMSPTEKLEVAGNVKAVAFYADASVNYFPDYVFQNYYNGTSNLNADYDFKSLEEVETYIKENGHLPGYVSAEEVEKAGQFDMTATQLTNVEKIEELYLHSIEQEKKLQEQAKEIAELKALVKQLINN